MSDPKPPSPPEQSHADKMSGWVARQSFWYRLRHSLRFTGVRPGYLTALIVLAWIVPLIGVAGFGFYVLVHRFTGSSDFTRVMEQEVGEYLGLAAPSLSQAHWKAGSVALTDLSGEGIPSSYVRSFKLGSARFQTSFQQLFDDKWEPDLLLLQGMEVELRGGLLEATEAARVAKEQEVKVNARRKKLGQSGEIKGKYGINPSSETFSVNRFIARGSSIRWGLNERNSGKLTNTIIEGNYVQDGSWRIKCTGGEFTQGWLDNAIVDELSFAASKDGITITKFDFRLPQGEGKQGQDGVGQGHGTVTLGPKPEVALNLDLQALEVNRLLPEQFQTAFAGKLQGKATIKGSTSDEAGFSSHFDLEFQPGFGFGVGSQQIFPVLEVLGGEAADLPVRYLEATNGGITLDLADKSLKASGVKLETSEGERIEGFFTLDTASNNISGVFRIGLIPNALKDHPRLVEGFFREESAGLRWLTLPMEGSVATSTVSTADGLRAALKQQMEDRKNKR